MFTLFKAVRSFVHKGNLLLGYAAGLGILVMGFILFYEFVARYFLGTPTVWSQEISQYIFIWAMLGAAGYTLSAGKHIAIEIVVARLPQGMQRVITALTALAGTAFCGLITWQGYEMLEKTIRFCRLSPTPLAIPLWMVHSAVAVGFGMLTLQYIFLFIDKCCPSCAQTDDSRGSSC